MLTNITNGELIFILSAYIPLHLTIKPYFSIGKDCFVFFSEKINLAINNIHRKARIDHT